MHSFLATSLYGPAPGPRSGPRLHQPRPNWIGSGLLIQPTCHLCCYHHGPHHHADRRCSMAHTTAHESNRECGALDPRALRHVEHSGPETGPFQVSAGSPRPSTGGEFPVVIVPILAPGWAGTPHPRSTSTRLGGPEYVARAPALQAPRRAALRGKLLLAYALIGPANPTLRRHSRWGGPSPATPRCSPSGDAKRGSTPRSSYTTPSTLPREEGASLQ